jgi:hypothetical protein
MNVLHAGMQKSERQNITEVLSHHNSEVLLLRGVVVDTVTRATWCYEQPEKVYTRAKLKGRLQAWLPECDHTFILQIASLSMINQRDGIALKVNTLETLLSHYVHLLGYQGSFFGQFRQVTDNTILPTLKVVQLLSRRPPIAGLFLENQRWAT